jgi:hypothetical protein
VAFIELVSDRNTSVLRKKILLEQGAGGGEFLLPDDMASGIYTVLIYTNWLKNFGESSFHRKNIVVINPDQQTVPVSDTCGTSKYFHSSQVASENSGSEISILSDKEKYGTREKVTLKMKSVFLEGQWTGGLYSVSVYRKEPGFKEVPGDFSEIRQEWPWKEMEYLPDFGGIRLTGKLEDEYGALQGARIIMSLPGQGTVINSADTDDAGRFNFLLPPRSGEMDIIFSLPLENAVLKLEEPFWNGLRTPLIQQEFCLDNTTAEFLEMRYYHFQLQSKFNQANFKQEIASDGELKNHESFYHHTAQHIRMDDYVSLDSLPEYFYELVPSVKFISNRGNYDIRILDRVSNTFYTEEPGVFVDGVLYTDYNQIARIPVNEMAHIRVLPEVYYYRNFMFGGIIDLHTKKSDFTAVQPLPHMIRLVFPLASKADMVYDSPDHPLPDPSHRIPDYRYLICWEPDVTIEPETENTIEFYTGDITGEFVIKVNGISNKGKIIHTETRIFVGDNKD